MWLFKAEFGFNEVRERTAKGKCSWAERIPAIRVLVAGLGSLERVGDFLSHLPVSSVYRDTGPASAAVCRPALICVFVREGVSPAARGSVSELCGQRRLPWRRSFWSSALDLVEAYPGAYGNYAIVNSESGVAFLPYSLF
jgi:hypothetical protein